MKNKKNIENEAKDLLKTNDLFNIPVNPIELAKLFNIEVKHAVFDDPSLSGMVAKRDDKTVILVNINDTPYRKRFTIAHELGHYFLHLEKEGEYIDYLLDLFRGDTTLSTKSDEIEANQFAAALLMNEELVKGEWQKLKDIDKMAEKFKVSKEAMGYRLLYLGLI